MALRKPAPRQAQPEPSREARKPDFKYRASHGIQASVWENKGEFGHTYSVNFQRSYYDEDKKEWVETDYYRESDLLILAELARTVWSVIISAKNEAQAHEEGKDTVKAF